MNHLAGDRHLLGLEDERVERRVDRSLERVLDRHERALDVALLHRDHAVVDRGEGNGLDRRAIDRGEEGLLAEGALGTQECDAQRCVYRPRAVSIASFSSGESSNSDWPSRTPFTYMRACSRCRIEERTTPVPESSRSAIELD